MPRQFAVSAGAGQQDVGSGADPDRIPVLARLTEGGSRLEMRLIGDGLQAKAGNLTDLRGIMWVIFGRERL